jgi:hypothetical protein
MTSKTVGILLLILGVLIATCFAIFQVLVVQNLPPQCIQGQAKCSTAPDILPVALFPGIADCFDWNLPSLRETKQERRIDPIQCDRKTTEGIGTTSNNFEFISSTCVDQGSEVGS